MYIFSDKICKVICIFTYERYEVKYKRKNFVANLQLIKIISSTKYLNNKFVKNSCISFLIKFVQLNAFLLRDSIKKKFFITKFASHEQPKIIL